MDRAPSYSSRPVAPRSPPPNLPPWENRQVSRVPYLDPSSPAPHTRRPSWSTRSHSQPYTYPSRPSTTSPPPEPQSGFPAHRSTRSYPRRPSYPSDYPPQTQPPCQAYAKGDVRPQYVDFMTPRDPPSPPSTSTSFSNSGSSTKSSSPPPPADSTRRTPSQVSETTKAFPGTMSARTAATTEPPVCVSGKVHPSMARQKVREREPTKGKRFRSAFKDMFKREPVDESQFERIGEKHWADED